MQAVRRLVPPVEAASQLRGMVQHRYELVHESTQRKNKLTSLLDEVFPEFTRVLHLPNTPTALKLRSRFPTPASIATASLSSLQEERGKTRLLTDEKLLELQRLAEQSIGTKDTARLRGLVFEQNQLIRELQLIQEHLEQLEMEMAQILEHSREGQILTSIPGIGTIAAANIIAMIGNLANFDRPSQLKSYFGWAPAISQSGSTLDRTRLSPRGTRLMKYTIYLAVWQAVKSKNCEWSKIYEHLVPIKCSYDERRGMYVGKGKIIGRIAGQMISVIFTLLKKDQETLSSLSPGANPPEPVLYDPDVHHRHRSGQYHAPASRKRPKLILMPPH